MDIESQTNNETHTLANKTHSASPSGLGQRLKTAREKLRLSEKEAAARLHLNVQIIHLIENENFENAPPITFLKGYIRSYARLLHVPEHDISEMLAKLDAILSTTVTIVPAKTAYGLQPKASNRRYIHIITYFIIGLLLALVIVWWSSNSRYLITDLPAKNSIAPPALAPTPTTTDSAAVPPATLPTTIVPPAAPSKTETPAASTTATPTNAAKPSDEEEPEIAQPAEQPGLEQSNSSDDNSDDQ